VGVAGWPSEVQVRLPQQDPSSLADDRTVQRDTNFVVPIPKRLYLCGLQRVSFEHSYFLTIPPVFPLPTNGAGATPDHYRGSSTMVGTGLQKP
jgi:hypothetical protein